MKVSKKTGKRKFGSKELLVDNRHLVRREFEHMNLSDFNFVFQVRVSRRTVSGAWLENMWERAKNGEDAALKTLRTYVATLWSILTVIPDDVLIAETLEAVDGALDRHKDWYGLNDAAEEKEDI